MGSGGHRHQRSVDSHLISWAPPRFFLYPSDCLGWPLKSPSAWRWSLRRLPGPLGSLLSSPPPLVSASRSRSDYRGSTAPSRPAFGGPWRPLRRRLRHHPVAARRSRRRTAPGSPPSPPTSSLALISVSAAFPSGEMAASSGSRPAPRKEGTSRALSSCFSVILLHSR